MKKRQNIKNKSMSASDFFLFILYAFDYMPWVVCFHSKTNQKLESDSSNYYDNVIKKLHPCSEGAL